MSPHDLLVRKKTKLICEIDIPDVHRPDTFDASFTGAGHYRISVFVNSGYIDTVALEEISFGKGLANSDLRSTISSACHVEASGSMNGSHRYTLGLPATTMPPRVSRAP